MRHTYDGEWIISSLLDDRAERYPDVVAVSTVDEELTFGTLRDRAQRVAAGLQALGVGPSDRIATMLHPTADYLAVWFGVCWAGAIDVPVNTAYKGTFLAHVLRESSAKVLILDGTWVSRLDGLDLPDLEHVVIVGDAVSGDGATSPRPTHHLDDLLAHSPAGLVRREETDLVYVLFTSGTTGTSKGVMHVNRSALWCARATIDALELTHEDAVFSMFPLFHVTARSSVVTSTLWTRGRVILRDGFSVSSFWDDIRSSRATWFAYMGAVITLLHKQPRRPDDTDNLLRLGFGAAAPPDLVDDFERRFGLELFEVYGSTELGPATAPRPGRVKRGTMGSPCDHIITEIHDEQDRPLPPNVRGEIVCRPKVPYGLFQGYWNRPEETLHAFRNLWFHTGDAGHLDDDGHLVFADRIKDSLRRRGENISSFEVERAVAAHDDVLEAAAYAVPSELGEDEVMVAVVASAGTTIDAAELLRFCVATMPRFTVPRYLRIVPELPKTPSQRVQKFLLREQGVTTDTHDRDALGIVVPRD
jgi:crotonobetaine/carnitine-CoA ligase